MWKIFAAREIFATRRNGCRTGASASRAAGARFLTNDFRNCNPRGDQSFNPISLVCKLSEVEGRPAVKLSDNYAKAMGPPEEIERYRRIFGTEGVANVPVEA